MITRSSARRRISQFIRGEHIACKARVERQTGLTTLEFRQDYRPIYSGGVIALKPWPASSLLITAIKLNVVLANLQGKKYTRQKEPRLCW